MKLPPDRRIRRNIALSRLAIAIERWTEPVSKALVVASALGAVVTLDALPVLPPLLHAATLAAISSIIGFAVVRILGRARPPDRAVGRRRLEIDLGEPHRPLQALDDHLATDAEDPLARALWLRHRAAAATAAERSVVRWPKLSGPSQRWAAAAISSVGVLAILGVTLGDDPRALALRALYPAIGTGEPALVEVWINPPLYTRRAPMLVSMRGGDHIGPPLEVFSGSAVLARVTGSARPPVLEAGHHTFPFAPVDGKIDRSRSFRGEGVIEAGDRIVVRQGATRLAEWPIVIVPDHPPTAEWAAAPAPAGNGGLAVVFRATDDFGVSRAELVARRAPIGDHSETPFEIRTPAPPLHRTGDDPAEASVGQALLDLSASPLAGTQMALRVEVEDALGQKGVSEEVVLVAPEREFNHPVARAIAAERRRLLEASEAVRTDVADRLYELATRPDAFGDDFAVSLALAVAPSRLRYDHNPDAIESVRRLLWATALRLDDGDLPALAQRVSDRREELARALERNAPDSEIRQRLSMLKQAIDDLMAAMSAQLEPSEDGNAPEDENAAPTLDLDDILDEIGALARTGARDEAERLLAEMQEMLDRIQLGLQQRDGMAELQATAASLKELRALARDQQALLEETTAAGGKDPNRSAKVERQRSLRLALNDIAERIGESAGPQPLAEADQAMRQAVEALGAGRAGEAADRQARAVDALDRAIAEGRAALEQRMGGMFKLIPGVRGAGDPFGRAQGARRGFALGDFEIPDRIETQRAEEILRELRRRASERSRPDEERKYIERLLRQF